MEFFYKISKTQAEAIGKFEYQTNQFFDAMAAPQKDGTYLISASLAYDLQILKPFENFDFKSTPIVSELNNDPIIVDLFKTESPAPMPGPIAKIISTVKEFLNMA